MIVAVAGVQRHGSGKTQLILGLAKELVGHGLRVGASKPVSVTSLWYDHAILKEVVREGVLTDKDTITFSRLSLGGPPTVSNPVNVVTAVPDPLRYGDMRVYLDDLDSPFSLPIMARITVGGVTKYFRMHDLENRVTDTEVNAVDDLMEELGISAREVSTAWFYSYLGSREVGSGVAEVVHYLSRNRDLLLIESISTALLPVTALANIIDALIVVTPGRALLYMGEHVRAYISGTPAPNYLDTRHFIRFMKPALTALLSRVSGAMGIMPNKRLVRTIMSLMKGRA